MRIKLGIDMGTSNVVVAYMKGELLYLHNWVKIAKGKRLPAFVQFRDNKVVVGDAARYAWEKGKSNCYRRFKMRIGQEDSQSSVSPSRLMAHLVEAVKRNIVGSKTHISDISGIESVVVTVPHRWTTTQRQATRAAVLDVGLPVARLVSEPIAAAAYYAYMRKLTNPEIVLVCDMGGGTFDVTLTEIQPGRKIRILSAVTNKAAGTVADAYMAAHILSKSTNHNVTPSSLLDDHTNTEIRSLFRAVERVRESLNDGASWVEDMADLDPEEVSFSYHGQQIRYQLSYQEMVSLIGEVCQQAEALIGSLLAKSPEHQPEGVVLAGGMSKMLAVQEAIARATGMDRQQLRNFGQNADSAIAYGAALIAEEKVQVDELLPYGIGLVAQDYETNKERNFIMLRRGTPVPAVFEPPPDKGLRFRLVKAQSTGFDFKMALGDSEDPTKCKIITPRLELKRSWAKGTICRFDLSVEEELVLAIGVQPEEGEKQVVRIALNEVW